MKGIWNILHELKPTVLMVVVQFAFAAINVLYKLAINDGMNMRVASAYRLSFASASTVPLALIFDRKKRPKTTWKVLFLAFLCGLFGGSLYQNLFFEGLALMPATFMLAMFNLVPTITFIMAISCGLEKLNLGTAAGKAKVLGTIIGIGGAMLLTFFKGVEIDIWSSPVNLLHPHQNRNGHMAPLHAGSGSKLLGVICAITSYSSFSLWLIIQAKMSEEYPSHYSSTALMSTLGAMQAIVFALCVERDWSQWKLGWNIRLLAVAYSVIPIWWDKKCISFRILRALLCLRRWWLNKLCVIVGPPTEVRGIVPSGIMIIVIAWCIRMRGPVFASVFNPLQLVLVAVAASLMLNENLYLGSVLGSVLIVCGLYAVLWGKSKETKKNTRLAQSEITRESEAVEVAVISTPVDHDKCDHSNHSQTNATANVANDHH